MRRFILTFALLSACTTAHAGAFSTLVKEGGEWIAGKLGRKAVGEGAEAATHHADDAARFFLRNGDDLARGAAKGGITVAQEAASLSAANARRLAQITWPGGLGHADELAAIVSRRGDSAMDFIWRHRGSLAVGSAMVAFLNNPDPFLDGAQALAVPPLTALGDVARTFAIAIAIALVILAISLAAAFHAAARHGVLGKIAGHVIVGLIKK